MSEQKPELVLFVVTRHFDIERFSRANRLKMTRDGEGPGFRFVHADLGEPRGYRHNTPWFMVSDPRPGDKSWVLAMDRMDDHFGPQAQFDKCIEIIRDRGGIVEKGESQ